MASLVTLAEAEEWDKCHAMLDQGEGDVHERTPDGGTALHFAAKYGQLSLINKLLAKGAVVDAKDNDGVTPLHAAAYNGHTDAVKCLVEMGADVHAKEKTGGTPLHKAARGVHTAAVKCLVEKGADVHAKDKTGNTPLHDAASNGHTDAVKCLVEMGAAVLAKNNANLTPADRARNKGHLDLAAWLDRTASLSPPFTCSSHIESMSDADVSGALSVLGVSSGGQARLREMVQGIDAASWPEVLKIAMRRCVVDFLVGCGRSERDAARLADARLTPNTTIAQEAPGMWDRLIAEYCPRGPPVPARSPGTKVLVISPGFGIMAAPAQIRILERAYGAAVIRSNQHENPEAAGFDMSTGIRPLLKEIEEHKPAVILCASKGGLYMMKLWSLLKAGGHDHLKAIAYLMINVHPSLETLPTGVKVTLVQGAKEEIWPRPRGYTDTGHCEDGSLEALIRTGSPGLCHLYYTVDRNSGFGYRKGDTHVPSSLLEYDCLPRLVDALLTDLPAVSFQASSRVFLSPQRRHAEQRLGWHLDAVAARFQGDDLRVTVPPGSAEFLDVQAIFMAEPADGVNRFYFPDRGCEHVTISKIERVQNRDLKDAVDNTRGRVKVMKESMGANYEAGVHCRWLFHGAKCATALESIIENPVSGFAPQMGHRDGGIQLWGFGTYFALHASYSVNGHYCDGCRDEEDDCMIMLCLVDTGLSCVGEKHIRRLPLTSNKRVAYMSFTDSESNPEIFVTIGEQAYPAYIIHFS